MITEGGGGGVGGRGSKFGGCGSENDGVISKVCCGREQPENCNGKLSSTFNTEDSTSIGGNGGGGGGVGIGGGGGSGGVGGRGRGFGGRGSRAICNGTSRSNVGELGILGSGDGDVEGDEGGGECIGHGVGGRCGRKLGFVSDNERLEYDALELSEDEELDNGDIADGVLEGDGVLMYGVGGSAIELLNEDDCCSVLPPDEFNELTDGVLMSGVVG